MQKPRSIDNVESYLISLSHSIPDLQWWKFDFSSSISPKHVWISLPHGVQVVSGKQSLLPSNTRFLGRLNIISWGEDCSVNGIRITPSQRDQLVCIETRSPDNQSQILWIDINRPAVMKTPSGNKEVVDVRNPSQPLPGSKIYGWLSGLEIDPSKPQFIRKECFLVPVDFSIRDDVAVVLSRHSQLSDEESVYEKDSKSGKVIVVNPQSKGLYSYPYEFMETSQTCSSMENTESLREGEYLREMGEDLEFPATMTDKETGKSDTNLSETLVEIEDLFSRVVWIIQNEPDNDRTTRDRIIEAQRRRIEMQLEEMRNFEEVELQSNEFNRPLLLLEKLLAILTCLLEIGEKVNMHRRVDKPLLLQVAKDTLPKLTPWMKDQSKDDHSLLQLARESLSHLTNIQSALTYFACTDQSGIDLKSLISDAQLFLNKCIEREINDKLEDRPTDDRLRININNVLSNFVETFNEFLSKVSSAKFFPNRGNWNLQQLSQDLSEKANFLKANCAWISCLLDEEILERLGISQRIYNNLKVLYDHALKAYKNLIIRSRLVCEHSGLQALASRLTHILEQSSKCTLNRWEICQLEKELDSCEADCVFEVLTSAEGYSGFIHEVICQLRESIEKIRSNLNEVEINQESFTEEFLERLNIIISQPNRSISSKSSFESLLRGWYLQTTSTTSNQVNELISQLERNVSDDLQNPLAVDDCVSQLEDFIRQIPSTVPSNAEALSLRETLLIVSDMIHRGNAAVQLLERLSFLMNLRITPRLQELRFAYPRAVESLSLCFQALEGVLREFLEWRNTLLLVSDPDEADISTQAVIESTNFAMDVLTQEAAHTGIIEFIDVPDFLSKTLAWLSSLPSYLLSFPDAFSESRHENSTVFKQTDSLLHQILDLEWHLSDLSIQIYNDLWKEIVEKSQFRSTWISDIDELKDSVDIMKRRTFLSMQESIERSARSRNSNYYHVLASFREINKVAYGFSIVDLIVSREADLHEIETPKLGEEINKTPSSNGFGDNFSKLRLDSFFEQLKFICDDCKKISQNEKIIQNAQHIAECLRKAEVLSDIGNKWISVLKHPPYVTNRVLCCFWPETIKRLISIYQSQAEPILYTDWCKNAIDLRDVVAKSLVPVHLDPSGFQQNRIVREESFKSFRRSIKDAESILSKIPIVFKPNYEDVLQACSRLRDIAESYSTQLHEQIKNLTLYSLPKVKKDLQFLEDRLNELVNDGASNLSLELVNCVTPNQDCSDRVVQLERSLQAMRHMSRILFTCLAANPKSSLIAQPSEQLEVNELYKRAVKVVRDYEASEIGYEIVEAWKKLQEIADKLGRLQAGLPVEEVYASAETETAQSQTRECQLEEYPSASMARKRSWTLLEILGSHDCLYPGCRGKKRDKHCGHDMDDSLLHDLHTFYSFLRSDLNSHANRIPCDILTSNSNEAASSEIVLMKLREEWHHDEDLVKQYNNIQRRVRLNSGGDSDVKSGFDLIENIWGRPDTSKFVIESTRKLATVSSWLCEVEEQLEIVILPKLQASWRTPSRTDPLPVVEECVYKMNEIAEDLNRLQRCEMIAERDLQNIRHSLRAGWFSVREYLLIRCNKLTTDSVKYFPLVDDFVHHSAGLGFHDYNLLNIYSRLCGQFLLKGPRQRKPSHSQLVKKRFCSTKRSLRSLFLPYWFTERCRLVNDRPPVALTIHSLPDISTEAYPTAEPTFHSPRCVSINFRRWMSLPEIRLDPQKFHRKRVENSFSVVEEDAETIISPISGLHDGKMSTSGFSFFISKQDEGMEDVKGSIDKEYQIPTSPTATRKPELNDLLATPKKSSPTGLQNYPMALEPLPSHKSREKSPITWCTVYLPNDEETEPVTYPEIVPQRRVVEIADDPIIPQREVYAPMVFSAPCKSSDEQVEERSENIEDSTAECGPSITDDSGVSDWLRAQQAENIQRLIQEYGDGNDDMSLTEVDDASNTSPHSDVCRRNKNSISASFEESGLGEEEWSRKSLEVPSLDKEGYYSSENSEGHLINWGPIIERPTSPHLSVISEAPTDESALGKQSAIENPQLSSEETSGDEDIENPEEWMDINLNVTPNLQSANYLVVDGQKLKIYPSLDDAGLTDTSTPIARSFEDKDNFLQPFLSHGSQESGESDEEADKTISALLSSKDDAEKNESLASPNTIEVGHSGDELTFASEEHPDKNQHTEKADDNVKPFQVDTANPKSSKESTSQPKKGDRKSRKRKYQEIQEAEEDWVQSDLHLKGVVEASDGKQKPKDSSIILEMSSSTFSIEDHDEVPRTSSRANIPSQSLTEQNIYNEDVGNRETDEDSLEDNVLEDSLQELDIYLDEDGFDDIYRNEVLIQMSETMLNEPGYTEEDTPGEIKERTYDTQLTTVDIPSDALSDEPVELKAQPADQNIGEQNAEEEEGKNLEAAGSDPHSKEKDDEIHPKIGDSNGESASVEEMTKVPTGLIQEPDHDFAHPISSKLGVETRQKSYYLEEPIVPINEKRIEYSTGLDEGFIHKISRNSDEIEPIPTENIKSDAPSDSVSIDSSEWLETQSKKSKGRKMKKSESKTNKQDETKSAKSAALEVNLPKFSCEEGSDNLPEELEAKDPNIVLHEAPEKLAQADVGSGEPERSSDANDTSQYEKSGGTKFKETPFPVEKSIAPVPIEKDVKERIPMEEKHSFSPTDEDGLFPALDDRDRSVSVFSESPIKIIFGVDDAELVNLANLQESESPSDEMNIPEPSVIELPPRVPVVEPTEKEVEWYIPTGKDKKQESLQDPKAEVQVDESELFISSDDHDHRFSSFFKNCSTEHPFSITPKANGTDLMSSDQQEEDNFQKSVIPAVKDTPDYKLCKSDKMEISELSLFKETISEAKKEDEEKPSTTTSGDYGTSNHLELASLPADGWIEPHFKKTRNRKNKKPKAKGKDAGKDKDLPEVGTIISSEKETDWFGEARGDEADDLKVFEPKLEAADDEMLLEVSFEKSPPNIHESQTTVGENLITGDTLGYQGEVSAHEIKEHIDENPLKSDVKSDLFSIDSENWKDAKAKKAQNRKQKNSITPRDKLDEKDIAEEAVVEESEPNSKNLEEQFVSQYEEEIDKPYVCQYPPEFDETEETKFDDSLLEASENSPLIEDDMVFSSLSREGLKQRDEVVGDKLAEFIPQIREKAEEVIEDIPADETGMISIPMEYDYFLSNRQKVDDQLVANKEGGIIANDEILHESSTETRKRIAEGADWHPEENEPITTDYYISLDSTDWMESKPKKKGRKNKKSKNQDFNSGNHTPQEAVDTSQSKAKPSSKKSGELVEDIFAEKAGPEKSDKIVPDDFKDSYIGNGKDVESNQSFDDSANEDKNKFKEMAFFPTIPERIQVRQQTSVRDDILPEDEKSEGENKGAVEMFPEIKDGRTSADPKDKILQNPEISSSTLDTTDASKSQASVMGVNELIPEVQRTKDDYVCMESPSESSCEGSIDRFKTQPGKSRRRKHKVTRGAQVESENEDIDEAAFVPSSKEPSKSFELVQESDQSKVDKNKPAEEPIGIKEQSSPDYSEKAEDTSLTSVANINLDKPSGSSKNEADEWADGKSKKPHSRKLKKSKDRKDNIALPTADNTQERRPSIAADLVAQGDYSSEIKSPDENSQLVRSGEEKVSDQSQIDKKEPIGVAEKLSPEDKPLTSADNVIINNSLESNKNETDEWIDAKSKKPYGRKQKKSKDIKVNSAQPSTEDIQGVEISITTNLVGSNKCPSELKSADEHIQSIDLDQEKETDQSKIDRYKPVDFAEKLPAETDRERRISQESELPYSGGKFTTEFRDLDEEGTIIEELFPPYSLEKAENVQLASGDSKNPDKPPEANQHEPDEWANAKSKKPRGCKQKKSEDINDNGARPVIDNIKEEENSMKSDLDGLNKYPSGLKSANGHSQSIESDEVKEIDQSKIHKNESIEKALMQLEQDKRISKEFKLPRSGDELITEFRDSDEELTEIQKALPPFDFKRKSENIPLVIGKNSNLDNSPLLNQKKLSEWIDGKSKKPLCRKQRKLKDIKDNIARSTVVGTVEGEPILVTKLKEKDEYLSGVETADEDIGPIEQERDLSKIDKNEVIDTADKSLAEIESDKKVPQESEVPCSGKEFAPGFRDSGGKPIVGFREKADDALLTSGGNINLDNPLNLIQNEFDEWIDAKSKKPHGLKQKKANDPEEIAHQPSVDGKESAPSTDVTEQYESPSKYKIDYEMPEVTENRLPTSAVEHLKNYIEDAVKEPERVTFEGNTAPKSTKTISSPERGRSDSDKDLSKRKKKTKKHGMREKREKETEDDIDTSIRADPQGLTKDARMSVNVLSKADQDGRAYHGNHQSESSTTYKKVDSAKDCINKVRDFSSLPSSIGTSDISKENPQSDPMAHDDSPTVKFHLFKHTDNLIGDIVEPLSVSKESIRPMEESDDAKSIARVSASELKENQKSSSEIPPESTLSRKLIEETDEPEILISNKSSSGNSKKNCKSRKSDSKKTAQAATPMSGAELVDSGSTVRAEVEGGASSLRLVGDNIAPSHPLEREQSLKETAVNERENFPSGIELSEGNVKSELHNRSRSVSEDTEFQAIPSESLKDRSLSKLENTPQNTEEESLEAARVYEMAPYEPEPTCVESHQDGIFPEIEVKVQHNDNAETGDMILLPECDYSVQSKIRDGSKLSDLGEIVGLQYPPGDISNDISNNIHLKDPSAAVLENQSIALEFSKRKRKSKPKKGRNLKEKPVDELKFTGFLKKSSGIEEQSDWQSDSTLKQMSQDEEERTGYPTLKTGLYEVQQQIQPNDYSYYHDNDYYVENPLAVERFLDRTSEIDEYEGQLKESGGVNIPHSETPESLPSEYQSKPCRPLDSLTEELLASDKSLKIGRKSKKHKGRKVSAPETATSSNIHIQLDEPKHPSVESVALFTKPTTEKEKDILTELLPFGDSKKSVNDDEVLKGLEELDADKPQKKDEILSVLPSFEERQPIEASDVKEASKAPIDNSWNKEDVKTVTKLQSGNNKGIPLPKSGKRRGERGRASPQSKFAQNFSIEKLTAALFSESLGGDCVVHFAYGLLTSPLEKAFSDPYPRHRSDPIEPYNDKFRHRHPSSEKAIISAAGH
ncbi:hypothetical protein ACTXT7_011498 [Hymenolepis weldensis]